MENTQQKPLSQSANDAIHAIQRMMLARIPADTEFPGGPKIKDVANTPFQDSCDKLIQQIIQTDRIEWHDTN